VNVLKHMEAAFVVTVAILGSAAFVTENLPEANARNYAAAAVGAPAAEAPMAVVYVTAKRMTPEQKRLSLEQERRAVAGSRT
jgi:UDP-N-acetylmuramyl pentapeptide synthase